MTVFITSVWDRLTERIERIEPSVAAAGQGRPSRASLEQHKRSISRDLEVLLNTRVTLSAEELAPYPACRNSILNFGVADFAQLCLTSSDDRKIVCDLLTSAIARHEPRLTHVRARLVEEEGVVNRLSFAISGQLRELADKERVQFDVMLESSTMHYSIR